MEKTLQSVSVDGMKYSLIQVWDDEPGSYVDLVGVEESSGLRRLDVRGDTRYGREPLVKGSYGTVSSDVVNSFLPRRRATVVSLLTCAGAL